MDLQGTIVLLMMAIAIASVVYFGLKGMAPPQPLTTEEKEERRERIRIRREKVSREEEQREKAQREKLQQQKAPVEYPRESVRSPSDEHLADAVEFTAYAPADVRPSATFVIDVWAYLRADRAEVRELAAEVHRDVVLGRQAGVSLARGTEIVVQLDLPGFHVAEQTQHFTWIGDPVNVSFIVSSPDTFYGSVDVTGKIHLVCQGIPAGTIPVTLRLRDQQNTQIHQMPAVMFKTAFASYASADRPEVLSRLQGMKLVAPQLDIFVDILGLRSGDNWAEKLRLHVPTKDRFFLFWSTDAAASEWVEREWRLALETRGISYINPVPIQPPDVAHPPVELSSLHFSDSYLAYITAGPPRRHASPGDIHSRPAGAGSHAEYRESQHELNRLRHRTPSDPGLRREECRRDEKGNPYQ